jgi:hypothetical protein
VSTPRPTCLIDAIARVRYFSLSDQGIDAISLSPPFRENHATAFAPRRLTCVFLATKTENCSTSIDQFAARIPNSEPADILALEFLVSQSLHFEYKVHHAHVALNGLVLDMQVRVFTLLTDPCFSPFRARMPYPRERMN